MKARKRIPEEKIAWQQAAYSFLKSNLLIFYIFFMFSFGIILANLVNSPESSPEEPAISSIYPPAPLPEPETKSTRKQPSDLADTDQDVEADPVQVYDVAMIVKRGDTFSGLLAKNGADREDIRKISSAIEKIFSLRSLKVGQKISMSLHDENDSLSLKSLRINWPDKYIYATRQKNDKFDATEIKKELAGKFIRAEGVVRSSLMRLGSTLDVPANIMAEVVDAYSFDIDFQREIQPGSSFELLYKVYTDESGKQIGSGDLYYASLGVRGSNIRIFRYETSDGDVDYFKEDGRSVRKSLLRTPVSGGIVSSPFGKRKHPILGYTRLHKGVDFAASRGTPILAAGDGRIEFIGRKGGYGNYIRIRHNNKYYSAYAHMSRFAKGLRKNKRVKQGQIIGYVGSTGASTGPHLHYEILVKNRHTNPLTVKIPPGKKLRGKEFANFKKEKERVNLLLSTTPVSTKLANR